MNQLEITYPTAAGFKSTDTSREAAESTPAASLRTAVLRELERGAGTADEIADRLKIDRLSIRPRLSELRNMGRVDDTGQRRVNASNKRAIVWALGA